MTKLIILMVAALGVSTSMANTPGTVRSEAFWQAPADKNIVTPSIDYTAQSADVLGSSKDQAQTGPTVKLNYERGFTDAFSAGMTLGYLQAENEIGGSDSTSSGLTDMTVTLKGQRSFVPESSLHYGAYAKISTGDKKFSSNGSSNAQSGGSSFTPYIGYQWIRDTHVFGTKLTQTIFGTDRKIKDASAMPDRTEVGGGLTRLAGFYEFAWEKWNFGGSVKYEARGKQEITKPIKSTITDAIQLVGFEVYPTWQVNETTTLVGSLGYSTLLTKDPTYNGQKITDGNIVDVSLGGRFNF